MDQLVTKGASLPELMLRGLASGALITVLFTASNVYLGLKVGLTFSSSIPAAVISMAVLQKHAFRRVCRVVCRRCSSIRLRSERRTSVPNVVEVTSQFRRSVLGRVSKLTTASQVN